MSFLSFTLKIKIQLQNKIIYLKNKHFEKNTLFLWQNKNKNSHQRGSIDSARKNI
jgi:hypothetical protein